MKRSKCVVFWKSLAEFSRGANECTNETNFSRDNDPTDSLDRPVKYQAVVSIVTLKARRAVGFVSLAHNASGGALKWRTRNFTRKKRTTMSAARVDVPVINSLNLAARRR